MTENNLYNDRANQPGSEGRRNQDRRNQEEGASERWLEAALAPYTAAEPRAGLEERILANLRGVNLREDGLRANLQSKSAPVFRLWRRWLVWIAAGAAAAMVLVALARKPGSIP